jgi:hypothetical protein
MGEEADADWEKGMIELGREESDPFNIKQDCVSLGIDPRKIQLAYIRNLRNQAKLFREAAEEKERVAHILEKAMK